MNKIPLSIQHKRHFRLHCMDWTVYRGTVFLCSFIPSCYFVPKLNTFFVCCDSGFSFVFFAYFIDFGIYDAKPNQNSFHSLTVQSFRILTHCCCTFLPSMRFNRYWQATHFLTRMWIPNQT